MASVSIQILQYEFLGPVALSEWGPPMGELLYIVLSKDRDKFNMLYAGDCEHTDDAAFFVQHKQFGCWAQRASSESALYLAVFPMKGSNASRRQMALRRILSSYKPPCNPAELLEKKPSYDVRKADSQEPDAGEEIARIDGKKDDANTVDDTHTKSVYTQKDSGATETGSAAGAGLSDISPPASVLCPCCGAVMSREKNVGASSALYRCGQCGMSDTRII